MASEARFAFALHSPHDRLREFCHAYYTIESGEGDIDDIVPAFSPQLILFARGEAELRFHTGSTDDSFPVSIISQIEEAASYTLQGPSKLFGVSLTIPGWIALGGPSMDRHANRMQPAETIFGMELSAQFQELRNAMLTEPIEPRAVADRMDAILLAACKPLSADQERVTRAITEWLDSAFDPQVADLQRALALSSRQIQRLSRRYFGRAPSALAKRRRAVRAAHLLASKDLPETLRDEIFAAYFDQAHLIREIRRFTGRTPKGLEADAVSLGVKSIVGLDRSNDELFEQLVDRRREKAS